MPLRCRLSTLPSSVWSALAYFPCFQDICRGCKHCGQIWGPVEERRAHSFFFVFFLRVNNIKLYVYTIFSLSIDLSVAIWVISISCIVWIMLCTAMSLILISVFLQYTSTSGTAGSCDSFISKLHDVFHSG